MKRHVNGGNHKAFTLLEVLVASTILGVGILGLVGGFSVSTRTASRAMRLDGAVSIAQRELQLTVAAGLAALGPRTGEEGIHRWKVELADRPDGLMAASVSVSWQERGRTEQFRLTGIFLPPQGREQ